MTFMIQGKDYEGKRLYELFPREVDSIPYSVTLLQRWIAEGNRVLVSINDGARAGTLGQLVLPEDLKDLYGRNTTYRGSNWRLVDGDCWQIKFDDNDKTVKLEGSYRKSAPGTLVFEQQSTKWVFTTKERPKVELPVLHDHFGVQLEVGQVCLALIGRGNDQYVRLGKITRWSEKATIWVETMKTREKHPANKEETVQGSINIFVLDGDIRAKAMMAKLKFA